MDKLLGITHPGRMGDAIYALPTIKELCKRNECKANFYTSEYCAPLRELFLRQSYINDFIVDHQYRTISHDCGVQPWYMGNIDIKKYFLTHHLGFHYFPHKDLVSFIAESVGIHDKLPIEYEFDYKDADLCEYVVVAGRGKNNGLHRECIDKMIYSLCRTINVVEIGEKYDLISDKSIDRTGLNFLETLNIIAQAKVFVGLMSSQLCLANGFSLPKICVYDGAGADMRHCIHSETNHYLDKPDGETLTNLVRNFI